MWHPPATAAFRSPLVSWRGARASRRRRALLLCVLFSGRVLSLSLTVRRRWTRTAGRSWTWTAGRVYFSGIGNPALLLRRILPRLRPRACRPARCCCNRADTREGVAPRSLPRGKGGEERKDDRPILKPRSVNSSPQTQTQTQTHTVAQGPQPAGTTSTRTTTTTTAALDSAPSRSVHGQSGQALRRRRGLHGFLDRLLRLRARTG